MTILLVTILNGAIMSASNKKTLRNKKAQLKIRIVEQLGEPSDPMFYQNLDQKLQHKAGSESSDNMITLIDNVISVVAIGYVLTHSGLLSVINNVSI